MRHSHETPPTENRAARARAVLGTPVSMGTAVLLIAAVAAAAGDIQLDVSYDLAMIDAVGAVRTAHAEARSAAAESGAPVRLLIAADEGRVRVWYPASEHRGGVVLLDDPLPQRAWIESDVVVLCFDGRGRPQLDAGCEEHRGSIAVRTRRGGETWLTVTPDGQLVWSGTTIGT